MMKHVLVTGGAGFIGSNFVRYLLRVEPDVQIINLDALTYAGSLENLQGLPHERHVFVHGNITDRTLVTELFEKYQIDTVVHFAAESHVDRSILGPAPFIETNIVGTFTLLDVAREKWAGRQDVRFHHVSTDEVYGTLAPDAPPFSETTPYDPRSPYSASKASSDHLVRAYWHTYGLPVSLTNCSNNYGPYQFPEKLIPLMILNALQGRPLPVYGDGQQIRDWLYVEDHCEGIYRVLRSGQEGETYNIGGGNQPTNLEIVQRICALLDELAPAGAPHDRLITFVQDRPGHDRRYAMDTRKMQTELGWQPHESLESGLRRTVQWYLEHLDWVAAVTRKSDFKDWLTANYDQRERKQQ